MRMELIVDREIDDGRFVVTNNSRIDIPIGSVFSALFSRTGKLINGEIKDRQESSVTTIDLVVTEVEFWRKAHACVPYGHHASIQVTGKSVHLLQAAVRSKPEGWQVFIGAE